MLSVNVGDKLDRMKMREQADPQMQRAARLQQLLSTKLKPPQASMYEVSRVDVCEHIFDAGGAKVALICAPAGFGKTTVMNQVRKRCETAELSTAWLTLDPADNDVGRFLAAIAGAIDTLVPGSADELGRASSDGSSFVLQLLNRIADRREPFLLFLDDFEVLHSSAVIGLVQQIVEHLPTGAQLVIGSRSVPQIGLGRLRAKGWLIEIDPAQLRFTLDEARSYLLEHRKLALAGEDVLQLHQRTEGWPAGLWLASLALEQRARPADFVACFSGSHAAVAEYLTEDVFARQPAELKIFLLRASILDYLNISLCNAVCACGDSEQILERLARANLFLIAEDGDRARYRFHSLFADFLRSHLLRTLPDEVPALHRAAAKWYLEQERPVPAIDHALRSGDLDFALPLLAAHAEHLLAEARMRQLARWLGNLPPASLRPYPHLRSIYVWVTNFTRGPQSALTMLASMSDTEALESDPAGLILVLRPMLLSLVDRVEEAYELGQQNMTRLPEGASFARSMLHIQFASAAIAAGRFAQARTYIDEARRAQATTGDRFGFAFADAMEGEIDLLRGHLRQAIVRLQDAVDPRIKDPLRRSKANAMAAVLLAESLYETGDCDGAERLLSVYVPFLTGGGLPNQLISGNVLLARIAAHRGDHERAVQLINELELLGHRMELRRVVLSARLERARLCLTHGRLDSAKDELEGAADEKLWARISALFMTANDLETFQIGMLRWMIRSGRAEEALPLLAEQVQEAERVQRPRRILKLRILTAEALKRTNQGALASRAIGKALRLASREGFVQSFADEGDTVAQLVRDWVHTANRDAADAGGAIPQAYVERLLSILKLAVPPEVTSAAELGSQFVEPLTRREIEVLRLMSEGLSNRALSERMFVSQATTRTHLRNINVKLGVHSRVQAIAVARRRGIIP